MNDEIKYNASFLWPYEEGSLEELGYQFANAITENYQKQVWNEIINKFQNKGNNQDKNFETCPICGSKDLFKFKLEHVKCRKCGKKYEHEC